MSLKYINSDGIEQFIAGGGGGGTANVTPLTKAEFDALESRGELEKDRYYAITDDVEDAENDIGALIAKVLSLETVTGELDTKITGVDARISADGETLPLGSGTVYGAVNALNDTLKHSVNEVFSIELTDTTYFNLFGARLISILGLNIFDLSFNTSPTNKFPLDTDITIGRSDYDGPAVHFSINVYRQLALQPMNGYTILLMLGGKDGGKLLNKFTLAPHEVKLYAYHDMPLNSWFAAIK